MALIRLLAFADNDTTPDAPKVLDAMLKVPNVTEYLFVGDGPYDKDSSKWIAMMKKYFPTTEKLRLSQGNHEHKESESQQSEDQIEAWIPSLMNENDSLDWVSAGQRGNVYIICMNTQDLDVEFKRDQYNWVMAEIGKAVQLKKAGKVDWIVCMAHKPFFTLKSSHSPYTAVRKIYNDPFVSAGVDFMLHGHNHNTQLWFPMVVDTSQEANGLGVQKFKYAADGKTFDFSKDGEHGILYIVTGHAAHEWNPINDSGEGVKNVMHFRDSGEFGFTQLDFDGKKANVKSIDATGKVHFEYNVIKGDAATSPTPQPQPQPQPTPQPGGGDPNAPTTAPPGPGFKWDTKKKAWIPMLEHPSFIPDDDEPDPTEPKPTPTPIPKPTDPTGETDQMGIKWLVAKGAQSMIEQTREKPDDHRWSGNVTGLKQGFEMTMIAKSVGVASDGHFAAKHGGGNHSGGNAAKQRWYDTGFRSGGEVQLQWEGPHPKNHSFELPDSKLFIKTLGKKLEGNYHIGLKWVLQTVKPDSSPATGGIRCRMWVDKDAIGPDGKPRNNWELVYDFIDGVDAKVIQPQDYQIPDEMDMEIRRSGHKSHEVYGGGLHVRAL